MPDLGVEWPDLNQPEPAAPPEVEGVAPEAAAEATEEPARTDRGCFRDAPLSLDDHRVGRTAGRRGGAQGLRRTVGARRRDKKTANAAQIDRRARADAELLAELLRSQGYYDATVEPQIEAAGNELAVTLRRDPGSALPLPVGRAAGAGEPPASEASGCATRSRSRRAIRSSPQKVIAAGVALKSRLASGDSRRPRSASRTSSSTTKRRPRGWSCR